MNAIRRLLGLATTPKEPQNIEDPIVAIPDGMFSRAFAIASKHLFGPFAPDDLSSDHEALLEYFGSTLSGDGGELNLANLHSELVAQPISAYDPFVEQRYRPGGIVVELIWEADDREGEEEEEAEALKEIEDVEHRAGHISCEEDIDFASL
ncbi:hypothetical protein EKO04_006427 [Ascochyta lentis]|uniref:Uncharacterized protein n=1 Tax=Ascochyta lentis TaxID=205686 RepID=A0A8H7J044_9PLEO|nr:hypothetical protein EKO04_006427 [Ascochyta lentis]